MTLRAFALSFVSHQGLVMVGMARERNQKYALARAVADSLDKPLLVVGGPYGSNAIRQWFAFKAHGSGDI
jgi:hypothetical protein